MNQVFSLLFVLLVPKYSYFFQIYIQISILKSQRMAVFSALLNRKPPPGPGTNTSKDTVEPAKLHCTYELNNILSCVSIADKKAMHDSA